MQVCIMYECAHFVRVCFHVLVCIVWIYMCVNMVEAILPVHDKGLF